MEFTKGQRYLECVVIGMGINAKQVSFSEELKLTATSLELEGANSVDRMDLIACIMRYFEQYYKKFIKTESLRDMTEEYNASLINLGRQVRILGDNASYTGTALGINEMGALLVQTEEISQGVKKSVVKTIVSGEVSVRGIYGYV